jgi:hypothetical protein
MMPAYARLTNETNNEKSTMLSMCDLSILPASQPGGIATVAGVAGALCWLIDIGA